jgi:hypothetical protein
MQGLQKGMFGRFVFTNEDNDPFDIEGTEIDDIDHHNIWLKDKEGTVYNVRKSNVERFEPMRRPMYYFKDKF